MTTTTTTAKTQARYDLEFMADMIGVERKTLGGLGDQAHIRARNLSHYSDEKLAAAIAERAADPIANARAQRRIFDLAMALPRAQVQP